MIYIDCKQKNPNAHGDGLVNACRVEKHERNTKFPRFELPSSSFTLFFQALLQL